MKPYYEADGVTLYHGDCLKVTEWLSADVLVTDPPYGMGYQSGSRMVTHAPVVGDGDTAARDAALGQWGDIRPALVFGTWRAVRPQGVRAVCIWDKTDGTGPGMGDLSLPFGTSHEEFYLLGKWTTRGRRAGSVVRSSVAMGNPHGVVSSAGHPTAKPVPLLERLLEACPPGVVADPFAGSGSTLVAARNLGRKAIGVEIEERYCEIIARRLDQAVLPL